MTPTIIPVTRGVKVTTPYGPGVIDAKSVGGCWVVRLDPAQLTEAGEKAVYPFTGAPPVEKRGKCAFRVVGAGEAVVVGRGE